MENSHRKLISLCVVVMLAVTGVHCLADTPVGIADTGLYDALFDALGEEPTEENMATLSSLYADSYQYTIYELTGLEYAYNLVDLSVYGQPITDYSPISSLFQLQILYLGGNPGLNDLGVTSLPLCNFFPS